MIRAVCNSNPLIGSSVIDKLELLWCIFDEVYIAEAVYDEIVNTRGSKTFGIDALVKAVEKII